MNLTDRPIAESDLLTCATMLARGLAYPDGIADHLPGVWRSLMRDEALTGAVVENSERGTSVTLSFGISVFVTDRWAEAARIGRTPYLTARTIRTELSGDSPILRSPGIARANGGAGLEVIILHYCEASDLPADLTHAARLKMLASFIDSHRGYRIKGILQEFWDEIDPEFVLNGWGRVLTDYAAYFRERGEALPPLGRRPHLVGLSRKDTLAHPGNPMASVFVFTPPLCKFSRAEQKLLRFALTGKTDVELASSLGLSLPTIKSRWRSIHLRAARALPSVLPPDCPDIDSGHRGREKRRRLLYYLRSHPEELRPMNRRKARDEAGP
ncbi:MAG TPA: hypothetical protein VK939_05335 [Longimicrobiales bacterium]|nr:hypothetical protein [Longimicrobiales bacterium]